MFRAARAEIAERVLEGSQFLRILSRLGPAEAREAATCRGLLFVHLYGIYEYAVRASVQGALDFIQNESLSCADIRRSALALVLHQEWTSTCESGPSRRWSGRNQLIDKMLSKSPLGALDNTLFPTDGSHFRCRQLWTIWGVFGITLPIVPQPQLQGRIDELVENRNAIAHGRRTAHDVGRAHSDADMVARVRDTDEISSYVIDTMDSHCTSGRLEA